MNSDVSNTEFNVEGKTFQQPKCIQSASSNFKASYQFSDTDEDSYNSSLNSINSPLSLGLKKCDFSFHANEYEAGCKKVHLEQVSDEIDVHKIIPQPITNSDNLVGDNSNSKSLDCCKKNDNGSASHRNLNSDKNEIIENNNLTEESDRPVDTDETDITDKKTISICSVRAEYTPKSYHQIKHQTETRFCRNDDLNSPEVYVGAECIVPRDGVIELATNAISSADENKDSASGMSSCDERNDMPYHQNEENIDVELLQDVKEIIQHKNTVRKTDTACNSGYNSNSELSGNKHHKEQNCVKSLSPKTDKDFHSTILAECVDVSPDQHHNRKESKKIMIPTTQDTCSSSDFVQSSNKESLHSSNLSEVNNSDILLSNTKCRKHEKCYSSILNIEDKVTEMNENDVSCCSDYCKQFGSTSDAISNPKLIKFKSLTNTKNENESGKLVNDNLLASDYFGNVEVYGTSAGSNEVDSFIKSCDSPPSPEEKVIYDSQGNIMSSSTECSQYSLCLGNHYASQDDDVSFVNSSKVLVSSISECSMVKSPLIQDGITYKSVLNLMKTTQLGDNRSTEQLTAVESLDKIHPKVENECLKENDRHYSSASLVCDNTVEKGNELHNVYLEQLSCLSSSESNSEILVNKESIVSSEMTCTSLDLSERSVDGSRSLNESNVAVVTLKKWKKNTVTSIQYDSSKCHNNLMLPAETKSSQHQPTISNSTTESQSDDAQYFSSHLSTQCNVDITGISDCNLTKESLNCNLDNHKIDTSVTDSAGIHNGNGRNTKVLNTTELSKLALEQNKTGETFDASKGNNCDILKSDKQEFKSLSESFGSSSLNCAQSSKLDENNACNASTCSCVPKSDSSDEPLNELPVLQREKSNILSSYYSFYNSNVVSNFECNTTCSSKNIKTCRTNYCDNSLQGPFQTATGKVYSLQKKPPSFKEIVNTLDECNIPQAKHKPAFYSCFSDVPRADGESVKKISELQKFQGTCQCFDLEKWQRNFQLGSQPNSILMGYS